MIKDIKFHSNWFDAKAEKNFGKFLLKYKGKPGLKFLEIGCFEGKATLWLLQNILTDNTCKIVCIDPFQEYDVLKRALKGINYGNFYETFKNNTKGYENKVITIIGRSQDVLMKDNMRRETFDFIYIDGSHRSPDVIQDAILSFGLLKKGCIMIFDDYRKDICSDSKDSIEFPKLAIDCFLNIFRKEIKTLLSEYQVVIEKL